MSVNDNLKVSVLQRGQILLCECGNNDLNNAMIEVDEKSLICLKCKKCICKLDELDDGNELNGASGKANDFATNVEDVVYEKKRKTYNKITSFDQLKRGDHIMMECSRIGFSYWHHAIVTDVTKANTLIVIHYSSIDEERLVQLGLQSSEDLEKVTDRSFDKGQVIVEEIDWFYTGPTLYRVDYPKSICYSIEEVVSRAMQRLGERSYNLLLNNCEHFARWCKTGNLISEQISEYKNAIGKHIKSALVILKELFGVPNLIKFIQANRPAATIASNLIDDAAVAINAQLTYPNLLPVGLAAVGVALSTIVDIALTIPDILKQRQLMKEGHISEQEYLLTRNAMLINCGATFDANLTITMAASLIGATLTPIPFVGPFLALTVSIAGSYFGVKLGKKFGNKLEAKYRERRTRIMIKSNSSDIVKKIH